MYEFSLDRNRIILLVSGLVLAAILLFVAGMTVGLAHSGDNHSQAKATRAAPPFSSVQQPQNSRPAATAMDQAVSNPSPPPNPIASAASLAPRQETAPAPPSRLHAAHAKPETAAKRPSPPAQSHHEGEHGPYVLQAGAFSSEANAGALQQRLMHAGYAAQVTHRAVSGREWYIVTVGRYTSEKSARSAAQHIEQRIGVHTAVRQ